jgi:hypothetical protein
MGLIRCVLKHKQAELNLNDPAGRFHIARDFVPPSVSLSPDIATGSAANRMGGGTLVGMKAENRRWSFGVHITGDSEAEVRSGISLLDSFLRRGTPSDPVYVHVRGSEDVGFEPLWGQYGADLRYEVIYGIAGASRQYSFGFIREGELPECQVQLEIKPFALGLQQRLASALGGILEDYIGAEDGLSRGTIIPEATTNKFTNPVFGHATWDNGWTATSLIADQNTDRRFISAGKSSVRLYNAAGPGSFTQSINVGNTNTHVLSCRAKLPDSGAISATHAEMYYNGAAQTTTYKSEGDGWYRLAAVITGVASAVTAGINTKGDYVVYADEFQIEEKGYATPPCNGDMLGCAWSGTAHASTTTRTNGRIRLDETGLLENRQGTIRLVVRANNNSSEFSNTKYVFMANQSGSQGLHLLWSPSPTNVWQFRDGSSGAASSATSFSAGDILIFHCVYNRASKLLYINGVQDGSIGSYNHLDYDDYIYFGCDESLTSTSYCNFTFLEPPTLYELAMSAIEIANDAANILEHVEDDRRLSPIPYLWTKDGDDVVDNCDDSTHDNYALIAGIPGTAKAETEINAIINAAYSLNGFWYARSLMPYNKFVYPTSQWYSEAQGNSSSYCSGGEYDEDTITTPTVVNTLTPFWPEELIGQIHFFGRFGSYSAEDDAKVASVFYFGSSGAALVGEEKTLHLYPYSNFLLYYLGSMHIEYPIRIDDDDKASIWGIRVDDVDGSVTFQNDFVMAINGEILYTSGTLIIGTTYLLTTKETTYRVSSNGSLLSIYTTKGNRIELEPERYNFLWALLARDQDSHNIADTLTFSSIKITPRWALL